MRDNKKTYWKGIEQLSNDPEYVKHADKEFPEYLPISDNEEGGSTRRDFLKMMGFGIAAASLAACEAPVRRAIPYVNKPVDVDPGVPNYYASTYTNGGDYCSIVVKTREGRPIKIEGNKLSKHSQGGVNAQVEASVLTLYDNERLRGPQSGGKDTKWETLDKEVINKLNSIAAQGGQISLVSNTILSPTTKQVIADFKAKYPTTEHVMYDSASSEGMLSANESSFGVRAIPAYDFSKADVIVSFGADFLGTWISPIEFTKQYSKTRKIGSHKKVMSRHYQFESNLSMTGSNADYRTPIKPSEEGNAVAALYNAIAKKVGEATVSANGTVDNIDKAAADLLKAKGKSVVVSGSNDPAIQTLVNGINTMLSNYGRTIDLTKPVNYRQGDEKAMNKFITDAKSDRVGAVIFLNSNPVYNHPKGAELKNALGKVSLKISTSARPDETATLVDYVAPDHHFLESWDDAEPQKGSYSLTQPTITPIFDTRQAQQSLLNWSGNNTDYYEYLQNYWKQNLLTDTLDFQRAWDKTLQDGVLEKAGTEEETAEMVFAGDVNQAAAAIQKNYKGSGVELALYQKVAIGDGSQANNPWLQEMPDPVSKATWDNYLTVSQAWAKENGVEASEGKCNKAKVTVGSQSVIVPILIQPGQAKGTVGLALGYGRTSAGKVANGVGVDATPFMATVNGTASTSVMSGVTVEVLDEMYHIAQTQTHQTYMDREYVVQESTLSEYKKNEYAGRYHPQVSNWMAEGGETSPGNISLWKGHKYNNHHWGMVIDLNSCTGCSACHIACQSENNIPVVGRQEVINRREMHWIRIDRYYSSPEGATEYDELSRAVENPEVTFQPMMCQHCNNAPCETVCPVAATTHSSEGLNQMTYNRCIGTRYCANNCPYKVRRFNWFKYHDNGNFEDVNVAMNNDLGKMVLNPDVTVRSRGVMEKCSLCIQRIQYGKLEAKKEGRRPKDGEINTACASACPADAIVFGDMNDEESRIYKMLQINQKKEEGTDYVIETEMAEPRAYHVLEEIGVKPNVSYLTKIRNKEESKA